MKEQPVLCGEDVVINWSHDKRRRRRPVFSSRPNVLVFKSTSDSQKTLAAVSERLLLHCDAYSFTSGSYRDA